MRKIPLGWFFVGLSSMRRLNTQNFGSADKTDLNEKAIKNSKVHLLIS